MRHMKSMSLTSINRIYYSTRHNHGCTFRIGTSLGQKIFIWNPTKPALRFSWKYPKLYAHLKIWLRKWRSTMRRRMSRTENTSQENSACCTWYAVLTFTTGWSGMNSTTKTYPSLIITSCPQTTPWNSSDGPNHKETGTCPITKIYC